MRDDPAVTALVTRARNGQEQAWDALVERYAPLIWSICRTHRLGGLATRLRPGPDGRPLGRAGILAASMWIAGVGARMVFYFAATHGAGPAITRFSVAHHLTGPAAWTAALVMMALADVLTRLAVVWMRGRRLTATATPAAAAAVQAGAGA